MTVKDDRTPEQKQTHRYIVTARDRFMSGWGNAPGRSYAGWACDSFELAERVMSHVEKRDEMRNVNINGNKYRPGGKADDHYHIYVVTADHRFAREAA